MILTPPIVIRLAVIVVLTVILQVSFFSGVPLLGTVANVVPVVVVAFGLLGGAVTGSVAGFAAGLLIDALLGGTLGVTSLSLMVCGYLAGRWREGYDIVSSLVPPLLAGALTGVAALTYGAMHLALGIDAPISALVMREVLGQALLGALLAIPIFPLIRLLLRPALVEDGSRGRARASAPLMGGGRGMRSSSVLGRQGRV